jgi:hypothetical protein
MDEKERDREEVEVVFGRWRGSEREPISRVRAGLWDPYI